MEENLVEWCISRGGSLHPNVQLCKDSTSGSFLRIRDNISRIEDEKTRLSAGTSVVTCPISLTVSYLNAISANPFEDHGLRFPEAFLNGFSPHTVTVFFLCGQYLYGEDSFWAPYIKALPQPNQPEVLGTPLWFTEEDGVWLRGTNLEKGYLDRERDWKKQWEDGLACLKEQEWDADGYTWTLAKWAATILSSRSFVSSILAEAQWGATSDTGLQIAPQEPFPVLIPVVDLLNHRNEAKVTWQTGPREVSLKIEEDLCVGQRVWNNYGPKSNEELLMGYGFCLDQNPFDQFALRLRSSKGKSADEIHYVRGPRHFDGGYPNRTRELTPFSADLLDIMASLVANDRERLLASASQAIREGNASSTRNHFAVANQLMQELRQKGKAITQFDYLLPTEPANLRQKNAEIYRKSQLSILQVAIESIKAAMEEATAHLTSGVDTLPGLFTLESAMKSLKGMDRALYNSFRRGLKTSLGTHDVGQLREAGWEEGIWTIWICLLKVWAERHTPETDGSLLSTRLSAWAQSMFAAYTSEEFRSASSVSSTSENVEEAMAEFLSVVQAMAEEQPSSVFGDAAWNLDLLRVGNMIALEEGMGLVLDERDETLGRQHVLHVELC